MMFYKLDGLCIELCFTCQACVVNNAKYAVSAGLFLFESCFVVIITDKKFLK